MIGYGSATITQSFGTYRLKSGSECPLALQAAYDAGYRSFDTAQLYQNEADVGALVEEYPDDKFHITTKVNCTYLDSGDKELIRESVEDSLEKLGQINLLLLHSPTGMFPQNWETIVEIRNDGLTEAVGVSNFKIEQLRVILEKSDDRPESNQIELSPYLPRRELVEYCQKNKIPIASHSPLVKGRRFAGKHKHQPLIDLAASEGCTPAQLLIGWGLTKGYTVLPRSANPEHIKENFAAVPLRTGVMDEMDGWDDGFATHRHLL